MFAEALKIANRSTNCNDLDISEVADDLEVHPASLGRTSSRWQAQGSGRTIALTAPQTR
jgi:hypothetical protein